MYDYVIITHLPAFYKVNLYNAINRNLNILVVFITDFSVQRTNDFVSLDCSFDHKILTSGNFESRNTFKSIISLFKFLRTIEYNKVVVGGWDLMEFWAIALLSPRSKNAMALESSVIESDIKGIKGTLKKLFLSRTSTVFYSGKLHLELLNRLKYTGKPLLTKGVGIVNKPSYKGHSADYKRNFLFLGRLSPEKNLKTLVKVFNALPSHNLLIVGNGELKDELGSIANSNISFFQHVDNAELKKIFLSNDILILPSLSEPWGLVVEEALYFGMPVVVSRNCGASELITSDVNGYIIAPESFEKIKDVVEKIDDNVFKRLKANIDVSSIDSKDNFQVSAYNEGLKQKR